MVDPGSRWLFAPPVAQILAVSTVLTAVGFAVARANPDRDARGELARWLDVLDENTLSSWWSTAVLLTAALAFAVTGAAARTGGVAGAGAWFTGAAIVGLFSLAELSGVHRRLDGLARLVVGDVALTRTWFAMAAVLASVIAAALVVLAARVGDPSRRPLAGGAIVLLVAAVGGESLAAMLGGRTGPELAPVLVAHLGELGENVGAALLLAAALRCLVRSRDSDGIRLRHRAAAPGDAGVPVRLTVLSGWLGGVSVALASLSLAFVLVAPEHPALHEVRRYVDLLVEHNLPTWWSVSLFAAAALAHFTVFLVARDARARGAEFWLVTAVVLAVLSLDDQSQLHERSEQLGRLLVSETGSFPFYWLIPGAIAGLGVAAAVAMLAVRVHGRARALLVSGIMVLLAAGLGLEAVQGLFMAAGNEGIGFVLGYHLEELAEDVGALLMIGAAAAVIRMSRGGGFTLRYVTEHSDDAGDPAPLVRTTSRARAI